MWNKNQRINGLQATIITFMAVIVAIFTASSINERPPEPSHTMRPQDFVAPVPTCSPPTPTPKPNKTVTYYHNFFKPYYLDKVTLPYVEMKLTSLGYYYITSYCPEECGWSGRSDDWNGWYTASGTVCHRASYYNRISEPTTCAISRSIHSFGDLFYIREFDRVFIAEDTGSAVRGKHLDLFYEDMSSVRSFPTGYYEVFKVEYVYGTREAGNYDISKYIHQIDEKGQPI